MSTDQKVEWLSSEIKTESKKFKFEITEEETNKMIKDTNDSIEMCLNDIIDCVGVDKTNQNKIKDQDDTILLLTRENVIWRNKFLAYKDSEGWWAVL